MKKNNVIPAIDNPSFTNKNILYIKKISMFESGAMRLLLTDKFNEQETFKQYSIDPLGNKVELTGFVSAYSKDYTKPKFGSITLKAGSSAIETFSVYPVGYPVTGYAISNEKVLDKDGNPTGIYHARITKTTAASKQAFDTCLDTIKKKNKKFWAYIVKDYKANIKAKEEGKLELDMVFETKAESKKDSSKSMYNKQTLSKYNIQQLKKLAIKHQIQKRTSKTIIEELLKL